MPDSHAVQDLPQNRLDASSAALLDNPIWSALTTDHAALALGNGAARRYPPEIGPLSGMATTSDAGYAALQALAGPGGVVALFLQETPRLPQGWTLVRGGQLDQRIALQPALVRAALPANAQLRALTADDAPAMVALAELTEPGPFRLRTLELGNYFGIFEDGRLAAMAGQRLSLPGCAEVSAVCTHPEARGRGYARMLMSRVMEEILRTGKVPFLHTFADNYGAIRVYDGLGFWLRRSFALAVVRWEG